MPDDPSPHAQSHPHPHPHDGHAHDHAHDAPPQSLHLFSPAGVLASAVPLRRAARHLSRLGFAVTVDAAATARRQRFAGDDATRLDALARVADAAPGVALATRGGYGLTRLLDRIDWPRLGRSVARGTRWVGHSDLTALHLGLMAHGQLDPRGPVGAWAGPLALDHFGRDAADGGVDDVTETCFVEAMHGELEAVGFRTEAGFDGLEARGVLWGGNLSLVCSLLGTPHLPKVRGGVLFLEDVNEHPYRVERMLLQLHQAGVQAAQKAVLLGSFGGWRKSPLDRGYTLKTAIAYLRQACAVPVLTGLPFGHQATVVCLPVGRRIDLLVQGREVLLAWGHA
jgi:muramoyltetrapeptide carboxypeptidase